MKLSFKTFCACLVFLYAGNVIAAYGGSSSYSDDRGRSNIKEKDVSRSMSDSHARNSLRDRSINVEKNSALEMTWEEYKNNQPKGDVVIKGTSLSFDYNNFGDLLLINEGCSFPELTELQISKGFDDLWTSAHDKVLSVLLSKSPNLEKLDLSSTDLTKLPEEIGNLKNLTELNLSINKELTELPREIGDLNSITKLNLSYTGFKWLPNEICKLENLEDLNLNQSDLIRLPKEIGNLKSLEILDLSYSNNLVEIPREIGNLENLQILNLGGTELAELPKEIGNLRNLTELYLGSTGLTKLPKGIGNLENLQILDLGYSHLMNLLEEIGKLTNLAKLHLGGTGLTALPKEIGNLSNLEELDLYGIKIFSSISDIPDEILALPKLKSVSLCDKNDRYVAYFEKEILEESEKRRNDPIYREENEKIRKEKREQILREEEEKELEEKRIQKEIKKPLADWPIVQKFFSESQEEYYYNNETWNKNKTLAENQEKLVNNFIDKCCDFSDEKAEKYKDQFIVLFTKIAKDPVGCEFLRVMLAKTVINNLEKISFVPVEESSGEEISRMAATYNSCVRNIKFSIKNLEEDLIVPVIKYKSGDLVIQRKLFPLEVSLLHELGHCFRKNASSSKTTISKRMAFSSLNSRDDEKKLEAIHVVQYSNDEEYHNMYGLTEEGLDLINESSYMAHRYGFIRLWHIDGAQEELWKPVKKRINLMRKYGIFDRDLYNFYLSSEFKKRCPKFGVGDFECSDLDPKTGKKLNSAK